MARTQSAEPVPALLPSVLIVDGDPDTRTLYREVFNPVATQVEECEDGAEALGKAICLRPALVITETRLRRIDGFSLCGLLRSEPATRSAAIIVVSSSATAADKARAITSGANEVIAKPCTPDALVAAAKDVYERMQRAALTGGTAPAVRLAPELVPPATERRRARSRTFPREYTITPPVPPRALHCPVCDSILLYEHSYTGGVNERSPEQWDYLRCAQCGPYQYRHRTRKLKAT